MKPCSAIILILIAGRLMSQASAIELSQRGSTAILSGGINLGDQFVFREFLEKNKGPLHVLELNSNGGSPGAATEIGRAVRGAGLSTLVDAVTDMCYSACTIIFSGGVRRHYINARTIPDGVEPFNFSRRGLGYHQGRRREGYPKIAQLQRKGYYALGTPRAAALIDKAPAGSGEIYRISGPTALSLGIATSLSSP